MKQITISIYKNISVIKPAFRNIVTGFTCTLQKDATVIGQSNKDVFFVCCHKAFPENIYV